MLNFFNGTATAMITPFSEDGSVNFAAFGRMIDYQIENGTDVLVILGTTGEPATMTEEEKETVMRFSVEKVAGRAKIVFGSGSNCTATQVEKSIQYQDMGADALLLIAPYYNKANPEGMYRHFATTADAVHIPCLLYNE